MSRSSLASGPEFPPGDVVTAAHDYDCPDDSPCVRNLSEYEQANQGGQYQPAIVERCYERSLARGEGAGERYLSRRAQDSDQEQEPPLCQRGGAPDDQHRDEADDGAADGEPHDNSGSGLRARELFDNDGDETPKHRRRNSHERDRIEGRSAGLYHHHDAQEADDRGSCSVPPDSLAKQQDGERHGKQGTGEDDRHGFRERHVRKGVEDAEHGRDSHGCPKRVHSRATRREAPDAGVRDEGKHADEADQAAEENDLKAVKLPAQILDQSSHNGQKHSRYDHPERPAQIGGQALPSSVEPGE